MPQYRVSYQFQAALNAPASSTGGSLYGWTENWYTNTLTQPQAIVAAAAWRDSRRTLLTPGWRISRARFAVVPSSRTAFTVNYNPSDGTGLYPPTIIALPDEQPYDVLICNAVSANGGSKSFSLGGIEPAVVSAGGLFTNPPNFSPAFGAWAAAITANFAVRQVTRSALNQPVVIAGVWTAPNVAVPAGMVPSPRRPVLQLVGTTIYETPPCYVRIQGTFGEFNINGTWRVPNAAIVQGGFTWVQLGQKRNVSIGGTWIDGGVASFFYYAINSIVSLSPNRGSSRKRGGAPGRPRGRRSVRRS